MVVQISYPSYSMLSNLYRFLLRMPETPSVSKGGLFITHGNNTEYADHYHEDTNDYSNISSEESFENSSDEAYNPETNISDQAQTDTESQISHTNDCSTSKSNTHKEQLLSSAEVRKKKYERRKEYIRTFLKSLLGHDNAFEYLDKVVIPQYLDSYKEESIFRLLVSNYDEDSDSMSDEEPLTQDGTYSEASGAQKKRMIVDKAFDSDLEDQDQSDSSDTDTSLGLSLQDPYQFFTKRCESPSVEQNVDNPDEENDHRQGSAGALSKRRRMDREVEAINDQQSPTHSEESDEKPDGSISESEDEDIHEKAHITEPLEHGAEPETLPISVFSDVLRTNFFFGRRKKCNEKVHDDVDLVTILNSVSASVGVKKSTGGVNPFFSPIFKIPNMIINHVLAIFVSVLFNEKVVQLFNEEKGVDSLGIIQMFFIIFKQSSIQDLSELPDKIKETIALFTIHFILQDSFLKKMTCDIYTYEEEEENPFVELFLYRHYQPNVPLDIRPIYKPAFFPLHILEKLKINHTNVLDLEDILPIPIQRMSKIIMFHNGARNNLKVPKRFFFGDSMYRLFSAVITEERENCFFIYPVMCYWNDDILVSKYFKGNAYHLFSFEHESHKLLNLAYEIIESE